MTLSLLALVLGFILDMLFGDPRTALHPICLIGNWIGWLERALNNGTEKPIGQKRARSARAERLWGIVLVILVIVPCTGVALLLLMLAQWVHPILRVVVEAIICWLMLATKSLKNESMRVYRQLKKGDIRKSRKAVAMIVGRDTQNLDPAGVTKATVETIAENTSDGIVAPLFYMMLGGGVLGVFYKCINTMDSMVGYRNDRYRYFGTFAAKLDDVVNFIPARLSALLMILASALVRMDAKNAWKIFRRDRYKHKSPNSAQTEAVMAGALDVELAGDAWYFGQLHKKDTIGDSLRPIEAYDIVRADNLLYATASLSMVVMALIKGIVILITIL